MKKSYQKLILFFLLACGVNSLHAQITVSGRVRDASGNPLESVNVTDVQQPGHGTVTQPDGSFAITTIPGNELDFTSIGYSTQRVKVENDTLTVTLTSVAGSLNEVVVVGYATQRRGNLTSAVSTINAEDLSRTTATTTSGALVGKASGITYRQASGVPGSITNIQIRNMGEPLYVIDGVMSDGGTFNNLNINDIENISILKDGAAAIYGFKAANGAILVTTKGGKFNRKTTISLNAYYGWQNWFRYPRLLTPYEWQYANTMKEVNRGEFNGDTALTRLMLEKWKLGLYDSATGVDYRGYDWKKAYVNNAAPLLYRDVSVSGGSDKVAYYFSFGAVNQDAVFKDYKFKRYNITSKIDAKVTNRLKIGTKLAARLEDRTNPGMPGSDDYEAARVNLFELAPIYRPYANDNPLYLNAIPQRYGQNMAAITNATAGTYDSKWYVLQNDWYADYKLPVKGLMLKGLYSITFKQNVTDNLEKGWREYQYDPLNKTYVLAYDKSAAGNTYNVKSRGTGIDQLSQLTLNYDSVINKDHHISAVAGIETLKNEYKGLAVQQSPIASDLIPLIFSDKNNTISDSRGVYTRMSYIFRLGYDYKQKYILNALGRYDGCWKFLNDRRWGFFPSVQVAWNLAKENFIANTSLNNTISNLKLRFSYGEIGDDNLGSWIYPDFAYLNGYNYVPNATLMTPYPGSQIGGQPVNGLKYRQEITSLSWVTSKFLNAGIDIGLLNNRLTLEFNAFKRLRSGLPESPNNVVIPVETGIATMPQNLNTDQTVGLEGTLGWQDQSGDFKYNIALNATLARQKFGKRYNERFFNSWDKYRWSQQDRWANVSPNSEMWMWEVTGRFKTQEEIDNYPVNIDGQNNATVLPGDLIFKDQNGDGLINDYDLRPLGYSGAAWPWSDGNGNRMPLFTAGLNLRFQYKGLDASFDFAGAMMNTFVMDWLMKWGVDRSHNGYYYNNMDVWHHENILDPQSPWVEGTYPALGTTSTRWWNTFYAYNVNYVRLRNAVLGYTLPVNSLAKYHINRARFYIQGTNLFSIDNLKKIGIDPEITRADGKDYPQHRVITFGVQLIF